MADGKIVLSGREETIKPIITMLFAINEMLEQKDIGEVVAMDLPTFTRGKRLPQIILSCWWAGQERPPYKKIDGKRVRINCKIPLVPKTKISYEKIVTAMGGHNGYMWGHWRAMCQMSEGNGQMWCYGASKSEAIDRLEAMASLSSADIVGMTVAEEQAKGARTKDSNLWKNSTRVFPHYCSIINQGLITFGDKQKGVQTLDGDFTRKKAKLWLYFKPTDWDSTVTELFKKSGYED